LPAPRTSAWIALQGQAYLLRAGELWGCIGGTSTTRAGTQSHRRRQ